MLEIPKIRFKKEQIFSGTGLALIRCMNTIHLTKHIRLPMKPEAKLSVAERMMIARQRIHEFVESGVRMKVYELALDLDLSEFYFARQFRAAFNCSPHSYYNKVRMEKAKALLGSGMKISEVVKHMGYRRPAELARLFEKESTQTSGGVSKRVSGIVHVGSFQNQSRRLQNLPLQGIGQ